MHIEVGKNGVTLVRDAGDKRIGKESTVTFHIRNLLNERERKQGARGEVSRGYAGDGKAGTWRRFYPDKVGLTGCRQGVWNGRRGKGRVAYWHERYAVEDAAEEFNKRGKVFYLRAEE